jgi:hypothetical protein
MQPIGLFICQVHLSPINKGHGFTKVGVNISLQHFAQPGGQVPDNLTF